MPLSQNPTRLGDILRNLLPGAAAGRLPAPELLERWRELVGPIIAARACPVCLELDGTLVVAARGAVWRQELSLAAPGLVEELGHSGFRVKSLKLVEAPSQAPDPPPPPRPQPLSDEEEARVSQAVAVVADPQLRQALARVYRAQIMAEKLERS